MKYVKIGSEEDFDMFGIEVVHFSPEKVTCKLSRKHELFIFGEAYTSAFFAFLQSFDNIFAVDPSGLEDEDNFVELIDPTGSIIRRS